MNLKQNKVIKCKKDDWEKECNNSYDTLQFNEIEC